MHLRRGDCNSDWGEARNHTWEEIGKQHESRGSLRVNEDHPNFGSPAIYHPKGSIASKPIQAKHHPDRAVRPV